MIPDVERNLRKVRRLIRLSDPDTLVIEDMGGGGGRSCRAHDLVRRLIPLADESGLRRRLISIRAAKRSLDGAAPLKQYRLARIIAARFPVELNPRMPQPRKPWMSRNSAYWVFEAVALGLAAFRPPKSAPRSEGSSEVPLDAP